MVHVDPHDLKQGCDSWMMDLYLLSEPQKKKIPVNR